ncbi:hypothetical protein J4440_02715 [Candidatus Woesearchaeota archaeon]|nr:hypothetical protein [Candidatus Woesearchaeota archaeon]
MTSILIAGTIFILVLYTNYIFTSESFATGAFILNFNDLQGNIEDGNKNTILEEGNLYFIIGRETNNIYFNLFKISKNKGLVIQNIAGYVSYCDPNNISCKNTIIHIEKGENINIKLIEDLISSDYYKSFNKNISFNEYSRMDFNFEWSGDEENILMNDYVNITLNFSINEASILQENINLNNKAETGFEEFTSLNQFSGMTIMNFDWSVNKNKILILFPSLIFIIFIYFLFRKPKPSLNANQKLLIRQYIKKK